MLITHSNPQFREYEKVDVTPKPANFFEKLKQKIIEPEHIYENRLKNAKEQLEIAKVRFDAGRISKSQYLFFKTEKHFFRELPDIRVLYLKIFLILFRYKIKQAHLS